MEQEWEKLAREAKEKKELEKKFPYLGKKVRRKGRNKWEYGTVVLDNFDGKQQEEFVKYIRGDQEQLFGNSFQIFDEKSQTWIEPF